MAIYKAGAIIANRYQVLQGPHENLGLKGGMGIVYLCIDHGENKRPVALKTFQPQYLSNRVVRNSFLREGTTWVDLGQHPHIVQAYEVIDARHGLEIYFVLELVVAAEGKGDASLYAWLLKGPLSLEQSLLFGLQIARGMMHATSQIPHLVHRDLKPGNILIGRDGLARVTDFGLARAMVGDEGGEGTAGEMGEQEGKNTAGEERKQVDTGAKGIAGEEFDTGEKESALTGTKETKELFSEKLVRLIWGKVRSYFSTSQRDAAKPSLVQGIEEMPRPRTQLTQQGIAGTPPYMPPAQWLNEELDARADIYAFGCILQEMITGQRAAPGDSLLQLEQIHLTGQLRPLPAKTPPSVRTLIQNCVALDKSKRYPNWQAVESAITTTYLKSTGQEPPPPPTVADATRADQIATGWSYNNMGLAYQNISQYKNAIGYFERAIEIGQAEAEPELEAAGLGNLGGSYRMLG